MEQQAKSVEQYKQEMLAQARRNNVQPAAPVARAQARAQAIVKVITPAPPPERVTPAEHVERLLERAEPVVEAAEPFAELALHSGLASAGAAMAAKGLELGAEALEAHIERKKEEKREELAAPPAPPAPPPPAPVVDINFSPQIVQEAPAVVAPTVTAPAVNVPTIVAPAVEAPAIVAPAIAAPVAAAQPAPAPPPAVPIPLPPPVQMPVQLPVIVPPPVPIPVAVPVQKVPPAPLPQPCRRPAMECQTITCTMPCRRPSKSCCPVHNPCRQSCCTSHRPAPCACKSPRGSVSWFMQPAAEAAYAAFDDDAMTAYMAPEAIPAASLSDVAYAETAAPQQPGYYELPAQDFASLDDFLAQNTARGILELQVRIASDDAAPVPGAVVDILKTINGVTYLFHHGVTDAGGSAGRIALPAPDRSLSFAPPNGFVPYAVYTVSVTHGDYAPQVLENVAVFPATQSLQVVRLGMAATPSVIDEGLYAM